MTGKSKWSEDCQRNTVSYLIDNLGDIELATKILDPSPSTYTIKRWIDKWTPIIEEEKRLSKIKQDKAERKHHKPILPRVKQDEYIPIPMKFLSVVEDMAYNWLSSYKSYSNPATVRKRAIVTKITKITKKEVDKK